MYISKNSFLFRKNTVAGQMDDTIATFDEWDSGFLELNQIAKYFKECTFIELIVTLLEIFECGIPKNTYLASLFGENYDYKYGALIALCGLEAANKRKEDFEKKNGRGSAGMDEGDKVVLLVKDVIRDENDIKKVELNIDVNTLNTNTIYLFMNMMGDINELEVNLKKVCENVSVDKDNQVTISNDFIDIVVLENK